MRRAPSTAPEARTRRLGTGEPDCERDECDDGEEGRGQRAEEDDVHEPARLADEKNLVYAVPHVYSAYAMVRHAAWLVRSGALGAIRLVVAEHASGWNAAPLERIGHKQAGWRTDPAIVGASAVLADVGVHAHHLTRFVTGLEVREVAAELSTLAPGRNSDDNAHVMLRMDKNVRGTLWASFMAPLFKGA